MNWLAFLTFCFINAATPGPNNITSMNNGLRYGFWKSIPFNYGIFFGFSTVMLLGALFCKTLNDWIPTARPVLLVLGTAYLLWLCWKILVGKPPENNGKLDNGFMAGLMLQFVNVKIYIYVIVAMQAFVLPVYTNPWVIAAFAELLAIIGCVCNISWTAFGSIFSKMYAKHYRVINFVLSASLLYCTISMWFTPV